MPTQRSAPPSLPTAGSGGVHVGLSIRRLAIAFAIAGVADAIGAFTGLWPPIVWAVDIVTAILLFTVLGWQWPLLSGLVLEAIPGVGVLPLWLLVVAAIALWGTARPKLR